MEPLNVLMVGTGEYTTGFVGGAMSGSDKKVGVVGLTLFDLRRRGKVGNLSMVGTSGTKFPAIREHLRKNISEVYNNLSTEFTSYPSDTTASDPEAYKVAIDALSPGDAVTIFTPDSTHFPIALYAIERGIHVLITKPATKLLSEHLTLLRESRKRNVLVYVEHHKRFDPAYADARHRCRQLGEFGYFYSYMSQPKSQLQTFKAWAGRDSDISYYLNSHHVDVCASMVVPQGWTPVGVSAQAARGTAEALGCVAGTEDTITLMVRWEKKAKKEEEQEGAPARVATGVYTASWTAPEKAGVHSQQYFHYLASSGEIRIDQAHRNYQITPDSSAGSGPQSLNPFYMSYTPSSENGDFAGQHGYGYISFEKFVDAVAKVKSGAVRDVRELDTAKGLPTLANTVATTAILEAGRRSLDEGGRVVGVREGKGEADEEQWEFV